MAIENVKCPDCGGPMASRLNRQKNQRFWGCRRFPDCRGTRDTDGMSKAERREASSWQNDNGDNEAIRWDR